MNGMWQALVPPSLPVQLAVAVAMLAAPLPRRDGFAVRLAASLAALAAMVAAVDGCAALVSAWLTPTTFFLLQTLVYASLLAAAVGVILLLFDAPPLTALFCAVAAYTMQNLASGVRQTAVIVIDAASGATCGPVAVAALDVIATAAVYAACHVLFVRRLRRDGLVQMQERGMLFVMAVVILTNICFDLALKYLPGFGVAASLQLLFRVVHAVICAFILFAEFGMLYRRRLRAELEANERLLREQERQYRLSRENIDAINIKCHDLRHQIRRLAVEGAVVDRAVIDDIAGEIDVYDRAVRTGNTALDTILTEKSLLCEREGITLTCIADGTALDAIPPVELYSPFGNALDNAIAATRALPAGGRRDIAVSVRRQGALAAIHIENEFRGAPRFHHGLPQSDRGPGHGFGMASMRATARRHGGVLSAGTHGSVFYLNVLLPLPPDPVPVKRDS